MFDFGVGYSEIFVIVVLAIVVIGPKDLPGVMRTVAKTLKRVRSMAGEFQGQMDQAMREAGVHDLKQEFQALKGHIASPALEGPTNTIASPAALSSGGSEYSRFFGAGQGRMHVPALHATPRAHEWLISE